MRVWHYTCGPNVAGILHDGRIKFSWLPPGCKERPAVWFSTNPVWEKTVWKDLGDPEGSGSEQTTTTEELSRLFGLFRITVEAEFAPATWHHYRKESGAEWADWKILERIGNQRGAKPSEWRVSWEECSADKWLAVEFWENGNWRELTTQEREGEAAKFANGIVRKFVVPDGPMKGMTSFTVKQPEEGEEETFTLGFKE